MRGRSNRIVRLRSLRPAFITSTNCGSRTVSCSRLSPSLAAVFVALDRNCEQMCGYSLSGGRRSRIRPWCAPSPAGGVGGGADALAAQLEIVRIGGAAERFFVADEIAVVE